jgi:alcohol-forming fatty acyl-CoA reductase
MSSFTLFGDCASQGNEIQKFYAGKTVMITGATGFVGKFLVATILEKCPLVTKIYLLIRSKNSHSAQGRFETEIRRSDIISHIIESNPELLLKLEVIAADITEDLTNLVPARVKESVQIFIHSAAEVGFTCEITHYVRMNLLGSLNAVKLAKSCSQLLSYVYLSTAYVNSERLDGDIHEKVYETAINPEYVLDIVLNRSKEEAEKYLLSRPEIMMNKHNRYVWSKALAEVMLLRKSAD